MKKFLSNLRFPPWTLPLALLAVCALAFGLLLPKLGFYWDDWSNIHVAKIYGIPGLWEFYGDTYRPLTAWTFAVFTPLVGLSPLGWQILALVLRGLTAWVFAGLLGALWPQARWQAAAAALLFLVYPVFLQQPIAVTYHRHWTGYLLYMTSLLLMVLSVRQPRRAVVFTLLALLALAGHLAIFEYYAGAELVRPLVLWLALAGAGLTGSKRFGAALLRWLPYLALFGAYVAWRLLAPTVGAPDPNKPQLLLELFSQPVQAILHFTQLIIQDVVFIMETSWHSTLQPALFDFSASFTLITLGVSLVAALAVAFYLTRIQTGAEPPRSWWKPALVLGLAALICGGLPIWSTGRQALSGGFADRYVLASLWGASLVWVALMQAVTDIRPARAIILGILIGLSVGLHLRTANEYRWSWVHQQRYAWQLYWRAPWLQPNTTLLSDDDIFPQVRRSYAVNLLYLEPRDGGKQLSYWFVRLDSDTVTDPALEFADEAVDIEYLGFTYHGTLKDSLVAYYQPDQQGNCLWVLGPGDADTPGLPALTRYALSYSHPERIAPTPAASDYPLTDIFGAEPTGSWCYYYEKADLARQFGDWPAVVSLGDAAQAAGFTPVDGASNSVHEWLPFIEGYARQGQWQIALDLTQSNLALDGRYTPQLCRLWQGLPAADSAGQSARAAALAALNCIP